MRFTLTLAAAVILGAPAAAQAPVPSASPTLSLEQIMLLRCSAAFAIAAGQAPADPVLAKRGREYFVRASARLMDELALTREDVAARLRAEVAAQRQAAASSGDAAAHAAQVMEPCLIALNASGL